MTVVDGEMAKVNVKMATVNCEMAMVDCEMAMVDGAHTQYVYMCVCTYSIYIHNVCSTQVQTCKTYKMIQSNFKYNP